MTADDFNEKEEGCIIKQEAFPLLEMDNILSRRLFEMKGLPYRLRYLAHFTRMLIKSNCSMQLSLHRKRCCLLTKSLCNKSITYSCIPAFNPVQHTHKMTILYGDNEEQLSEHLKKLLHKISEEAVNQRDIFTIGISGGSSLKFLTRAILSLTDYDLTKWKFFLCDERVVPEASEDSTFGAYKRELILESQLCEEQFVKIKEGFDADEAAADYIQQMELYFPANSVPVFDFLLLGMGPDGHTCSLFPEHATLEEKSVWVAPIVDSPKPPPQRITLTLPVLNNARNCVFVIAGEEKGPIAKRVFLERDQMLPAARVNPISGILYVIIENGLIN